MTKDDLASLGININDKLAANNNDIYNHPFNERNQKEEIDYFFDICEMLVKQYFKIAYAFNVLKEMGWSLTMHMLEHGHIVRTGFTVTIDDDGNVLFDVMWLYPSNEFAGMGFRLITIDPNWIEIPTFVEYIQKCHNIIDKRIYEAVKSTSMEFDRLKVKPDIFNGENG